MTRLTYRFGPLERRGLLGPVRAAQLMLLAIGALLAILLLGGQPNGTGAVVASLSFAVATLLALGRVGNRTLDEWTPVVCMFALRRLSGRARFRSEMPYQGFRAVGRQHDVGELALPAALRGVRILDAKHRGRPIGIVSDRGGRLLTAALACRVVAFSLLDAEAQERRLARWGSILSAAAGGAVSRLQWVERTMPAQGDELARWLHAERDPSVPLRGTPMIESYLELIGSSASVAREHEILIALQVDGRRVRGRAALADAVLEETERLAHGLAAAEVEVLGALRPRQLARVLRTAFDPYAAAELGALEAADERRDGVSTANAWPVGADEGWDCYRTDGALHSTYWIAGWPRVDVSPTFMGGLLGRSNAVRTVSVSFEPIPPARSTRDVEAAITRDRADRELRHRFGQSETARQRQAQEAAVRREAELAAGHTEVRFAGFVTVAGRDREELRRASAEVLEHAARARLELRCMYGQQAEAFTFTLPLGRGLR